MVLRKVDWWSSLRFPLYLVKLKSHILSSPSPLSSGPFITSWIANWRFNLEKSLLGSESLTGRGEEGAKERPVSVLCNRTFEKWTANTQFWNEWSLKQPEWESLCFPFVLVPDRGRDKGERMNRCNYLSVHQRGNLGISWHPVSRIGKEEWIVIWLMNETRLDSFESCLTTVSPSSPDFCSLSPSPARA